MYSYMNTGQLLEFELDNVTAKLAMMYKRILKYSKLQLSAKRNCLYSINPQNAKIIAKQALAYKVVLDGFAI